MKKTLAAVAVLGAFAGSAFAADVTLYGKIDLGLQYQNVENKGYVDGVDTDSFGMKSGINSGSRWGIKGTEQISEGLTVGFQLESGFEADDGSMKYGKGDNDRMFGREARLYVQTDFGELGFGRMGGLDSGSGSYDIFGGKAGVFGTGWSGIGSDNKIFRGMSDRYDNMITYKSPEFSGVTVYAQASLSTDNALQYEDGVEGSSDVNRYYAIGATGNWGALSSALVFSTTDYARDFVNEKTGGQEEDTSKVVSGFVAYDFGVVKTTLGAQYFDKVAKTENTKLTLNDTKDELVQPKAKLGTLQEGYGVMLGATAPIGAGTLYASLGYTDYEDSEKNASGVKYEYDAYQFGIGYTYPLSKRTYLYTAAGYTVEGKDDNKKTDYEDQKTTEVVAGIVHNF